MFPLAAVGQMEKKTQMPWNAASPYKGSGWRTVQAGGPGATRMTEQPLAKA